MNFRPNDDLSQVSLRRVTCIDDLAELKRWLSENRREILAVDTETGGLDWWKDDLRTIQLGDQDTGWCLDSDSWKGAAIELLGAYDADIVFHNMKFDLHYLETNGVKIDRRLVHDTRTMAHLVAPQWPTGLKPVSTRLVHRGAAAGQAALKKAMQEQRWTWATIPTDFGPYWQYAALDPVLTARIYGKLKPEVDEHFRDVYELEIAATLVLMGMERRGAHVDLAYCADMMQRLEPYLEQMRGWIKLEFGVGNPGSDKQVIAKLHEAGLTWEKKTEKGNVACDKEVLKSLPHPLARAILDYRDAQKLYGTYLKNFYNLTDSDGFLHASINPLGARTGRMSISRPSMQNLPRSQHPRNAIIARPEHTLVLCDYDQVEMRLLAHFAGEERMLEAIRYGDQMTDAGYTGYDVHSMNARGIYGLGQDEEVPKAQRNVTKNCVPLDTEALTPHGWVRHNKLRVGDSVLGYDREAKALRWTDVSDVYHGSDRVLGFAHRQLNELRSTPNHRWLRFDGSFVTTAELRDHPDERITLAAPCDADGFGDLTPDEAALIAWAYTDGSVRLPPSRSASGRVAVNIGQSELKYADVVRSLLGRLDALHREVVPKPDVPNPVHYFYIRTIVAEDIWKRAGLLDGATLVSTVAGLAPAARSAFLEAVMLAEGTTGQPRFSQNAGPVADALILAAFLEGHRPRTRTALSASGKAHTSVYLARPYTTGQRLTWADYGEQDVWCPETGLGTWVARQGDHVFVTGNSGFAKIYGAGIPQFARTAGISEPDAKAFLDLYDHRFPGVKRFQGEVARVAYARARDADDDLAWVRSPVGRRHPCETQKIYKLTNYLIQGTAADVFKQALVDLDRAGLSEYLVLPVHDEAIADVPLEEAEEYARAMQETMTNRTDFAVPLTTDCELVKRWGTKYVSINEDVWEAPDIEEMWVPSEEVTT